MECIRQHSLNWTRQRTGSQLVQLKKAGGDMLACAELEDVFFDTYGRREIMQCSYCFYNNNNSKIACDRLKGTFSKTAGKTKRVVVLW